MVADFEIDQNGSYVLVLMPETASEFIALTCWNADEQSVLRVDKLEELDDTEEYKEDQY